MCDCMHCPGTPVDNEHVFLRMSSGRERRSIQGFVPIQRVGIYYDREIEDKLRNRNSHQRGLGILKGYGPSSHASSSGSYGALRHTYTQVGNVNEYGGNQKKVSLDGQMGYRNGIRSVGHEVQEK